MLTQIPDENLTWTYIGMIGLAAKFDTSLQRISYANGATLICQGVANLVWM